VLGALLIKERTGIGQEVEVSLFNTATWVLGFDIAGCLVSEKNAIRPSRKTMANPIRNIYPTSDKRWIMLGMTNSQHYWPQFCKAISRPEFENDPQFATESARAENAEKLITIIENVFKSRTYADWIDLLTKDKLVWSPVKSPLEVTRDAQALANDFFIECDHPKYGRIKMLNNPIKFSKTPAKIRKIAPELGEHTDEILLEAGYSRKEIIKMKEGGHVS
jgi:crotonobetainyl-CoA:carnitine CoA-transferase CaiB-like acyl-CoA transferase